MPSILVTDSLFIKDEHVKRLEEAGFEVERLDKPNASEEELIEALKGKVGYILGGIEKVTDKVIDSTDQLKAISFTGVDWKALISGWEKAKEKGIKIANAPGGNSQAVAEFAVTLTLAMQRNLFELGRTGNVPYQTTGSLEGSSIGIVGAGNIGGRIIKILSNFAPKSISYFSRTEKLELNKIGAHFTKELSELLKNNDIIIIAAPSTLGTILDKTAIESLKKGALITSISPLNHFDFDALLATLQKGTLRAALDFPAPKPDFLKLPLHIWFNTNGHTGYNTSATVKLCSDMGTEAMINLLKTGEDKNRVI